MSRHPKFLFEYPHIAKNRMVPGKTGVFNRKTPGKVTLFDPPKGPLRAPVFFCYTYHRKRLENTLFGKEAFV